MVEGALVPAIAASLYWLGRRLQPDTVISRDGRRYLALGAGVAAMAPFNLRWLLPWICRDSVTRWRWWTAVHLVALPGLTAIWLSRWIDDPLRSAVGGLLICGLPGVWRFHVRRPVLVDGTAMAWALASAIAVDHHWWPLGLLLALVAGCIKESAPVFSACYAWHPLALAGLAAPLVRRLVAPVGEDVEGEPELARHPFRVARARHKGMWLDTRVMAAPWGVAVLAVLCTDLRVIPMLVVTLVLGYSQLLVATNTVRLYQWAAPPVILAAMLVIPGPWAIAALLVHLVNPWAGQGH
jgi:hypothetical protein